MRKFLTHPAPWLFVAALMLGFNLGYYTSTGGDFQPLLLGLALVSLLVAVGLDARHG